MSKMDSICSAVSTQYRHVMDGQPDGHRAMANTALAPVPLITKGSYLEKVEEEHSENCLTQINWFILFHAKQYRHRRLEYI